MTRIFGDAVPEEWLPVARRSEVERLARLAGQDRILAATELATALVQGDFILLPFGLFGRGEYLSDEVGCRVYPPFGWGVNLATVCLEPASG